MSTDTTLLDRYQDYRIKRYRKHQLKYGNSFTFWRPRARRRLLVGVLTVAILSLVGSSVFMFFGPEWSPLTWMPGALVMIASWTVLQHISGRQSDAPAQALDELDLQQRQNARSIGFTLTQAFVMVPGFILIWAADGADGPRLALGGGFLTVSALIAGSCTPGIILAWTRPDPDPEDL